MAIDPNQEFLVQPVDASWLQCNIECQEACPVGTNCRGYLNLAAEGRFEEGYILSRDPNPVAAMCAYVCSAPCERACRRGDIDRPLAIRAMKRFLVEWHEASGIPDVIPPITPRDEKVAVIGSGPAGLAVGRELAVKGYRVTVFDSLPYGGGTMLVGVPAFRLPREAIEMDVRLVERLGVTFHYNTTVGKDVRFEDLQRDYEAIAICAGAMDAVGLDIAGSDLDGVQYGVDFMKKANLGQPLAVGRNVVVDRRRLHRDGLLPDQPPPRRRERDDRLPADPLRARRRRGGAGRDGARGRPDGVPRQPDRARGRGREAHRACGSSATSSVSPTRPGAGRRSRSRGPSSWSRRTR